MYLRLLTAVSFITATPAVFGADRDKKTDYEEVVEAVSQLTREGQAQAQKLGLSITETTWEDNGRSKNSSLGSAISDFSIYVHIKDEDGKFKKAKTVPILRHENYTDKTADQPPAKFFIRVGNEKKNGKAESISLAEYLTHLDKYLSSPGKWSRSLLSPRDTDFLVSAQASFLPIPTGKNAVVEFNPAIYQYQSNDIPVTEDEDKPTRRGKRDPAQKMEKNPAVLAIVATREGTSATIIDNNRDRMEGQIIRGQPLFYNIAGKRAPYTATRKSDFVDAGGNPSDGGVAANGESGLGMVLLIQVPLKHKASEFFSFGGAPDGIGPLRAAAAGPAKLEEAVVGHGTPVGPYTELAGLDIQRDERYPIRVTVQFYKAVESAKLSEEDYKSLQAQINRIYAKASAVGSLVVEGETGRVTEHQGPKWVRPIWWTRPWWDSYKADGGLTEEQAKKKLEKVYGEGWKYFTDEKAFRAAVIEAQIKLNELDESKRPKTAEEEKEEADGK